jgi:hypothetical protein
MGAAGFEPATSLALQESLQCPADLAIDLLLVAKRHLEAYADDLCLRRFVLVWEQAVDDAVARVHIALFVEIELAAVREVAGAECEAAGLAEAWVFLRDLGKQLKRPALQLFGREVEKLLLGRGIEEFDRESRHLQTELRWIESSLASDIRQLGSFAGVFGQGLADLLRSDQLVQNLSQPLVPLEREDYALGLAMGTEDDRISPPSLLAKKLQVAREMISSLSAWNNGLRRSHG